MKLRVSLLLTVCLFTSVHASWIAGKKVVESIAGANDIPIDFASLTVSVHSATHTTLTTSHTDNTILQEDLQNTLQQDGVRETEAAHIAEWAGSAGSYASRAFEFKYVDEIGHLLVKQIMCTRKVTPPESTATPPSASELPGKKCKRRGAVGELKYEVRMSVFNAGCWLGLHTRAKYGQEYDFFNAASELDLAPLFPELKQMIRRRPPGLPLNAPYEPIDTSKIILPPQRYVPYKITLQQRTGEWIEKDFRTLPLFQGGLPFPVFYYDEGCLEWVDAAEDADKDLITVSCDMASAAATCPVPARKLVHHEKTVTRRVVGVKVKRWTERWTTQEPRGLTRAELDQLVDLMSGKVHEAIRSPAPPKLGFALESQISDFYL